MDYELAKELSENLFPLVKFDKTDYKYLTLEELIGECGDKFHKLTRNRFASTSNKNKWLAESIVINFEENSHLLNCGETPIEAVARLWLALNKK